AGRRAGGGERFKERREAAEGIAVEVGGAQLDERDRALIPGRGGNRRNAFDPICADLIKVMRDRNELPASAQVDGKMLALADLLPTLAAGFPSPLPAPDLPVRRGRLADPAVSSFALRAAWPAATDAELVALEGRYRLLAWSLKPAIDFA
ncbi:MAG TPA: hypothetical protein VNC50_00195, partial [Planctomycetia bacterium]|nr:hypothetical protein [Planctomycetia bacterium]